MVPSRKVWMGKGRYWTAAVLMCALALLGGPAPVLGVLTAAATATQADERAGGGVPVNAPSPYTFLGAYNNIASIVRALLEWGSDTVGVGETCPYVDDIMDGLAHHLPAHIRAQDEALDVIMNAAAAWEFGRIGGVSSPLVLAMTGSTGVGKSETAFRLAEAVLARSVRMGNSRRFAPKGMLVLRGEDYASFGSLHGKGGQASHQQTETLADLQRDIVQRVAQHVDACGGASVVIFDEAQKVVPGALDMLLEALGERGSISYTPPGGPAAGTGQSSLLSAATATVTGSGAGTGTTTVRVSTINCIFIFVSDIGTDAMVRLTLGYGGRGKVPVARYRKEVKSALDAHASTAAIASSVCEIVPFLPMERKDVEDVLRSKLLHIASDHRGVFWEDLSVDGAVIHMMSGGEYIKYKIHSTKVATKTVATSSGETAGTAAVSGGPEQPQPQRETRSQSFAVYGARALGVFTSLPPSLPPLFSLLS